MTPQRFVAVLLTDIVGSTEHAAKLRDAAWQELRRRHDALVRKELEWFGGREVNTAGDSFLATFDEPEQAIGCGAAIQAAVRELGLEIRSGVHIGKLEGEGRDIGGLAFHIVARLAAKAAPGEILVTEAVHAVLAGSKLDFEDRGMHTLKGLPGEWRLYAVTGEPSPHAAGVRERAGWTRMPSRLARPFQRARVPPGLALLALGFLLGLVVLFAWRSTHSKPPPSGRKVLAVLPFENLGAPEDEYFADGISDEVRGKLAALPGLEVIATGSSSEYKESSKSLNQIGRELGADYLVVGKVRWEKGAGTQGRVRVSPELVEVASRREPIMKWQAPIDASLTDVFQVQADIASQVAEALDVALGTEHKQALAAQPTANLAAYDAYLKGQEAAQAANLPSLDKAIGFYERAIALDSTFAPAWAQLSRTLSFEYRIGIPTSASAARAKAAADRAMALAPNRAESRLALGDYYSYIAADPERAAKVYTAGLQIAPDDADLLVGSAVAEVLLGRWESSVVQLTRAQAIDPRSPTTARRLGISLLFLRRYPEAATAFDRAVALAPADPNPLEFRAMVPLTQGDLEGARAILQAAPAAIDSALLVAQVANYADLVWVLDDAQQRLLMRLRPEDFGGDRAAWAISLAQMYAIRGDPTRKRVYADSARVAFEQQLRDTPDDPQRRVLYGLALAYLGKNEDAVREGERGTALSPLGKGTLNGSYMQHQLVRIYILVGEPEKALDRLEPLLEVPYCLSPAWLRIDPNFDPLRSNPRFQRLAGGA